MKKKQVIKDKFPLGLKILIGYTLIQVVYKIKNLFVVNSYFLAVLSILIALFLCLSIFGIIKRKSYGRSTNTFFLGFDTVFSLFHIISNIGNIHEILPDILLVIISIIFLLYLYSEKVDNFFSANEKEYSDYMPAAKLAFLYIITLGAYRINWWLRNWKFLKRNDLSNTDPIIKILLLLIPLFNIYLIYEQYGELKTLVNKKKSFADWSPGWMTFWTFILFGLPKIIDNPFASLLALIAYAMIMSIGVFPLISIQDSLNDYWDTEQKKLPKRFLFSEGEIVWVLGGASFWILIFIMPHFM